MYSIFNVAFTGSILLLFYIIVDFVQNRTKNIFKRTIEYSFIFYLLCIVQLTTGGILFPP
ncbi:hypothetical protein SAMN05421736_101980 [Evansella caseinilytica]|uniref:Uncharacterized protein n=1 Tax=Evansella caseinilytica TaxID=1503961 RepID=A0A1H3IZY5_9BACI|nr:hypothetical protein SAMN05421736_101980 [Evansella caseinilytica]